MFRTGERQPIFNVERVSSLELRNCNTVLHHQRILFANLRFSSCIGLDKMADYGRASIDYIAEVCEMGIFKKYE